MDSKSEKGRVLHHLSACGSATYIDDPIFRVLLETSFGKVENISRGSTSPSQVSGIVERMNPLSKKPFLSSP